MVKAKTVDKKIKASKKLMNKKLNKAVKKNVAQDKEIAKLRLEMDKLKKKKVKSGHISEYNFFVKKQIKAGLTFSQAAKQWNKYKLLQNKNKRRPSAYNQFIGSQMRLGKTFLAAVKLWKLAKAGKLGKKGSTRTVTKTVVRRIKSKPTIKYRTRTRTVVKKVRSKPKVIVKRIRSKPKVVTQIKYRSKKAPVTTTRVVKQSFVDYSKLKGIMSSVNSISKTDLKNAVSADDEEIAFKIVQTYFKEIARFGFKKQLTLDEIINAYLYTLARVKREDAELTAVAKALKEAGVRKN
ncbi:MAG: hypothetical protein AABW59_00975 [archaeon]